MSFPKVEGYVVTERVGSGSYSVVYKAYNKVGARTAVAIKCIPKSRLRSSSAVDNLITEIRLLKSLSHSHIVKMHDFCWDDKHIYIIMEYCSGGDLSKYIKRYVRVPEKQVLYFLQQLASALKFLREKGIAHMDLKPHNLLLQKHDGALALKLADFGFAVHVQCAPRDLRGSPLYLAPELLAGGGGGGGGAGGGAGGGGGEAGAGDLWSVGVIMYECLFGKAPYSSATLQELLDKIHRRAPIQIPPSPPISAGCRALLTSLLQHEPSRRLSYEELFSHPFLELEHAPSRENYDTGVSLISAAIEADSAGRYSDALRLYSAGLGYLVPRVALYRDRAGYAATVRRYMERAEAIKEHLKQRDDASRERDGNISSPHNGDVVTPSSDESEPSRGGALVQPGDTRDNIYGQNKPQPSAARRRLPPPPAHHPPEPVKERDDACRIA